MTSPPSPPLVDPIDTVTATDRLLNMTGIDEINSEVTQHGLGMFVSLNEHDPVTLRGTPPPTEALRLLLSQPPTPSHFHRNEVGKPTVVRNLLMRPVGLGRKRV